MKYNSRRVQRNNSNLLVLKQKCLTEGAYNIFVGEVKYCTDFFLRFKRSQTQSHFERDLSIRFRYTVKMLILISMFISWFIDVSIIQYIFIAITHIMAYTLTHGSRYGLMVRLVMAIPILYEQNYLVQSDMVILIFIPSALTLFSWMKFTIFCFLEIIVITTTYNIPIQVIVLSLATCVFLFAVIEKLFKEMWVIIDTSQKSKSIFINIFEQSPSEMFIINYEGMILHLNDKAQLRWVTFNPQVKSSFIEMVKDVECFKDYLNEIKLLKSNKCVKREVQLKINKYADDNTEYVEIEATRIYWKNDNAILFSIQSIQQRKIQNKYLGQFSQSIHNVLDDLNNRVIRQMQRYNKHSDTNTLKKMVSKTCISEIWFDLLAFSFQSKDSINTKKNFSLKHLIYSCIDVYSLEKLEKNATINLRIERDVPLDLQSDPVKLKAIFYTFLEFSAYNLQEGGIYVEIKLESVKGTKLNISIEFMFPLDERKEQQLNKLELLNELSYDIFNKYSEIIEIYNVGIIMAPMMIKKINGELKHTIKKNPIYEECLAISVVVPLENAPLTVKSSPIYGLKLNETLCEDGKWAIWKSTKSLIQQLPPMSLSGPNSKITETDLFCPDQRKNFIEQSALDPSIDENLMKVPMEEIKEVSEVDNTLSKFGSMLEFKDVVTEDIERKLSNMQITGKEDFNRPVSKTEHSSKLVHEYSEPGVQIFSDQLNKLKKESRRPSNFEDSNNSTNPKRTLSNTQIDKKIDSNKNISLFKKGVFINQQDSYNASFEDKVLSEDIPDEDVSDVVPFNENQLAVVNSEMESPGKALYLKQKSIYMKGESETGIFNTLVLSENVSSDQKQLKTYGEYNHKNIPFVSHYDVSQSPIGLGGRHSRMISTDLNSNVSKKKKNIYNELKQVISPILRDKQIQQSFNQTNIDTQKLIEQEKQRSALAKSFGLNLKFIQSGQYYRETIMAQDINYIKESWTPDNIIQEDYKQIEVFSEMRQIFKLTEIIPLSRPFVLISEDNELVRRMMQQQLQSFVDIDSCENGEIAVQKFKDNAQKGLFYTVILMDIYMPCKNGDVATEEIRQLEQLNGYQIRTKIVGVSGQSNPETNVSQKEWMIYYPNQ